MTGPKPVLHLEEGASWWGLSWGPILTVAGLLTQVLLDSSISPLVWIGLGALVTGCVAIMIHARRRHVSVEITTETVRFGEQVVPLTDIRELADIAVEDLPWETKAMGGFMPPRRTVVIPLRMADGKVVAAWSQRPDEFRARLAEALASKPPAGPDPIGPDPAGPDGGAAETPGAPSPETGG